PIWRQIAAAVDEVERRVTDLLAALASGPPLAKPGAAYQVTLAATPVQSTIGGGSLPGQVLPSWALAISGPPPQRLLAALRAGDASVVGRVSDDSVLLDLRTVEPADDAQLIEAIREAIAAIPPRPKG
ncbi:MAG TPA: hypothetical protein VFO60_04030, partial [Candidatus Dormibacteraeota bacterium]|nr:hypothetical protein [Candidatus Dormibacteraeota bacterium]